jgi:hypothetical protein
LTNEIKILENIDYIIEKFCLNKNIVTEENRILNLNSNEIEDRYDPIQIEPQTNEDNDNIVNF